MARALSVLALALAVVVAVEAVNTHPIIGIMTLPCDDSSMCGSSTEYFPASYVKSIEAGGARVVPIHYTQSKADIEDLLSHLNGVLFTGGGASLDPDSPYFQAIEIAYNFVVQTNTNGGVLPLWGTCLGFESICRAASQDPNVLTAFDAENYTIPLSFTDAAQNSRMFDSDAFPYAPYVMGLLSNYPITMNNHELGVSPSSFAAHASLSGVFDVLATNVDREGLPFVSLIEAKNMPIYGSQFHSEKPQWEWYPDEVIQHSFVAVQGNAYFMSFFVNECRRSDASFPDGANIDFIYNTTATYTDGEFTQCYFW